MRHHDPHQTFVPASPTTVAGRLPDHLDVDRIQLRFASDAPAHPDHATWRTPVSWHRGRRHGTGHLEVRPAGWGWSELELRWDAAGPPPPTRSLTRRSTTAPPPVHALERHLVGAPPTSPVPSASPAPSSHRRASARRSVLVAATTAVALLAGVVVVGPFGGATPVTSDDAVARFRAAAEARDVDAAATRADPAADPAAEQGTATDATAVTATTASGPDRSDPAGSTEPTEADPSAPSSTDTTTEPAEPAPDATAASSASEREAAARDAVVGDASDDAADRPAEGVYRYATDGWEELDARGSHRRFPEETVQTVHHTAAGFQQTWEPIEERRDEHTLSVATDPPTLVTTDTSRSFFGQQRQQRFTCTPTRTDRDGWTVRCDDDAGTTMTVTTAIQGTERRTVAGEVVEVVRARVTADLSGETEGRRTSTVWTRVADGLLVRSEVEADLQAPGPFGDVRYRERYTLDLAALEPQR